MNEGKLDEWEGEGRMDLTASPVDVLGQRLIMLNIACSKSPVIHLMQVIIG